MEESAYLRLADNFFLIFHTILILFNLFGWIWLRTRKLHLICISLTLASWIILGFWYGWGYCPLTDWHWDVLRNLGEQNLPNSYISYLLERYFGLLLPDNTVDLLTVVLTLLALAASVYANYFFKRK